MKVAKRETAVLIRLSEREKRTLKRKAANYGMTVSDYARTLLINSDDATIKVIDTEPLKKTAHELAKQGTNLNQFMKFLNTYGIKVFDAEEAQRVLAREVETFMEVAEALAALRREADRNNIQIRIDDFDNPDAEQEGYIGYGVLQRHGEFAEHGICGSYLEKADAREGRYPTSCRASIRCRKHVGWRARYEGTLSSFLPFRESETIQRETSCLDRA